MQKRQETASEAERQLAWSRGYLKREKRLRLLRRVVPLVLLAALCTVGVYAAAGGEFPAWPAGTATPPAPASVPAQAPADSAPASAAPSAPALQTAFTVTFDSRGGSDIAAYTGVAPGALLDAPDAPTREGYEFSGWYADEARMRAWDFGVDTVGQDMTLYAGWQALPAPDGGEKMPQTGVESGALWAGVLAAALALAALVACLLRRAYRGRGGL